MPGKGRCVQRECPFIEAAAWPVSFQMIYYFHDLNLRLSQAVSLFDCDKLALRLFGVNNLTCVAAENLF
jgi:hypothetical protein